MCKKPDVKVEDGFISRWSKKKNQLENPPVPIEKLEDEQDKPNSDVVERTEDEANDDVLTDEDMPSVESLSVESDYSGFLSPGVSDGLRKLALRKLFRSAKFNIRDGLDDYDDDFRSFAALGDIITSDMKHQIELAQEREKQRLEQEEQTDSVAETSTEEETDVKEKEEDDVTDEPEEFSDLVAEESEDQESKT